MSLGKPEGHLLTKEAYRNYRLEVEYRFPGQPGNCGVLVHASRPRALYKMFPQSIEVQMHSGNAGDFWVIQEDIQVPGEPYTFGTLIRAQADGDLQTLRSHGLDAVRAEREIL